MIRSPQRSPLAPIQGKEISPKKIHYSSSKDNSSVGRSDCNSKSLSRKFDMKENSDPNNIFFGDDKCVVVNTADIERAPRNSLSNGNKSSLTPKLASLEEDTSNLLTKLQASYQISCSILQEISKEKAAMSMLDLHTSPTKSFSNDGRYLDFEEVSKYCLETSFSGTDKVVLDVFQDVSSYCVDKMHLLSITAEVDALRKEKEDLLSENIELQEQVAFKSACYIQAEASIASMSRLIKAKEAALDEYDEFTKMNNISNANIIKSIQKQCDQQLIGMKQKVQSSNDEVKELESKLQLMEESLAKYKGMCKLKDRQLKSSVVTAANLERSEKEISDLQVIAKTQSKRIEYLTGLNDEINNVIASLTDMLYEKEQAIDEWVNFSKMNEEASKKLFQHIGKKHQEEMQETRDKINGLLTIIERQKLGESEYLRVKLKDKDRLQVEFDAMKLRLDSYLLDDQRLTDVHVIIAVITISSGFLLLFWSYIVADITN